MPVNAVMYEFIDSKECRVWILYIRFIYIIYYILSTI